MIAVMKKNKRMGKKPPLMRILVFLILALGAVTMLFPFVYMLSTSLKFEIDVIAERVPQIFPKRATLQNYIEIWKKLPTLPRSILNTLTVEAVCLTVGTLVTCLASFCFAKLKMPFKSVIFMTVLSGMMIPYAAVMLPQYRAYDALLLTDTLWPLILPAFFGNITMMFFMVEYMKGIPRELLEAARIDGAGYFLQFFRIVLPLSVPAISAQIIFWFVGIWNDFFAPSIYLTSPEVKTMQVLLADLNSSYQNGGNYAIIMTGAFLSSLPMLFIFVFCQKYFIKSLAVSAIKG